MLKYFITKNSHTLWKLSPYTLKQLGVEKGSIILWNCFALKDPSIGWQGMPELFRLPFKNHWFKGY